MRFINDEYTPAKKAVVYYHGKCPDGTFASACLKEKLDRDGVEATFIGQWYGREERKPELEIGADVFVLDFSFDLENTRDIDSRANSLTILDHHDTALKKLQGFECRCGEVHVDMNRSGAAMAWDWANPGKERPRLIEHIQDRDIWKWELEDSKAILRFIDYEMQGYESVERAQEILRKYSTPESFLDVLGKGKVLQEAFDQQVRDIVNKAIEVEFDGVKMMAVNCHQAFASEVGNTLAKVHNCISVMPALGKDGNVKMSLRSIKGNPCNQIAEKFGGGGHPAACGFSLTVDQFKEMLPEMEIPSEQEKSFEPDKILSEAEAISLTHKKPEIQEKPTP